MTRLTLTKHHGLGNDFLVVSLPRSADPALADPELLARRVCDRRRGIGADGLLIATPADGYTSAMALFNADGSRAEMSGNGIRCFAQAMAMAGNEMSPQRILTDAGPKTVELRATGRADTIEATVDMGHVTELDAPEGWTAIGAHPDRPVAHLSLGNPHTVVGVDDVGAVDLGSLGAQVPDVNLEIVEPGPEPHAVTMRVHERGAGITDACGTGACASAWAAVQWGLVAASTPEILVHMDGGSATVWIDPSGSGRVKLTGPARYVARIEIDIT